MCKSIEIGGKLIPVIPKEYRENEGYISCRDVIYNCNDIDCCDCLLKTPIKEEDIEIINSEDKLLEVEIFKNFWVCINATFDEINESGKVFCNKVINCDSEEFSCEACIFGEYEYLDLNNVNYRIID